MIRKKRGIYKKYQGTTMTLKSVAEQANVTQGTVYYHFRTKKNLMLEVVRHVCDSSWANVKNNQRPPIEKRKEA
ncbi:TetR/AcrR family transcriptional regulator [Bacillus halotolerans]|uniref:TetR/AcrR family transcriptional regulator n=1 Tax=Bacillus halotolerans TaxID=260554 RepID=UPI000BAA1A54